VYFFKFFPRLIIFLPVNCFLLVTMLKSKSKSGRRTNEERERDKAYDKIHFPIHPVYINEMAPRGLTFKHYEKRAYAAAAPVLAKPNTHERVRVVLHCDACEVVFGAHDNAPNPAFICRRPDVFLSKNQVNANRTVTLAAQSHQCSISEKEEEEEEEKCQVDEEEGGEEDEEEEEDDANGVAIVDFLKQERKRQQRANSALKRKRVDDDQVANKRTATSMSLANATLHMMADMQTLPTIYKGHGSMLFTPKNSSPVLYMGMNVSTDPEELLPVGAFAQWQRAVHLTTDFHLALSFARVDGNLPHHTLLLEIHGGRSTCNPISHKELSETMLEPDTYFYIKQTTKESNGDGDSFTRVVLHAVVSPARNVADANESESEDVHAEVTPTQPSHSPIVLWIDLDLQVQAPQQQQHQQHQVLAIVQHHLNHHLGKNVIFKPVEGVSAAILWLSNATSAKRASTIIVALEKQASTAPQDLFRVINMMGLAHLPAYLLTTIPPVFARAPVHAQCMMNEADLVVHLLRCIA
jgi:hypothetical protein